ncbi:hypothetical protein EEW87_17675 (plasmid) [Janibacter melonis]|uniref:JAB domain-containing protein n=1 Tax=Janibacter melonis TaxID=262209 RepID=A0A650GFS2_9MICO|nr:hypothetical protein [Janibacter melonis]QGX08835.1 hypothetical protein EEW87_17675 [Janibacter melonis]
MTQTHLQIGSDAVTRLIADVQHHGQLGVETGAVLLSPRGEPTVTHLAIAGDVGVVRRRGLFVLSAAALGPLFDFAEERDLQLRAQVHSHHGRAFLSPTDEAGNIRMTGFVAAVIPTFTHPSTDVDLWGWWTFDGSCWVPSPAASLGDLETTVLTFDAEGVRDE